MVANGPASNPMARSLSLACFASISSSSPESSYAPRDRAALSGSSGFRTARAAGPRGGASADRCSGARHTQAVPRAHLGRRVTPGTLGVDGGRHRRRLAAAFDRPSSAVPRHAGPGLQSRRGAPPIGVDTLLLEPSAPGSPALVADRPAERGALCHRPRRSAPRCLGCRRPGIRIREPSRAGAKPPCYTSSAPIGVGTRVEHLTLLPRCRCAGSSDSRPAPAPTLWANPRSRRNAG